jgi:hypothetical protein
MPNGDLIAAGQFLQAGGQAVNNIAQWNGTTWTAMASGLDDRVLSLAVRPNGELLAGGAFRNAGLAPVQFLARWSGSSWSPMPGEPNAGVTKLAVLANGDVLVGGFFDAVGSVASTYLARWNGTAWTAVPGFTGNLTYCVDALVPLPDGHALVSGFPSVVNPGFARYDGQAVTRLPDPGATFLDGARASNGEVFFVGDFSRPANVLSAYVTRYVSPCPASAARYGIGCSGSGGANELSAAELPWIGTVFRAQATGMPASGLVLAITGFTQISVPIASFLRQGLPGCDLLVSPDFVSLVPPQGGSAQSRLPVPALASLVGQVFYHQFLAVELDAGSNIVAATSTNGLRLTIGVF